MDPFEEIKQTFFQECEEQLAELETGLLELRAGEGDDETVNAVFRAVHSVKGGAGAFSLDDLVAFAHVFETVLEEVRSHRLAQSDELLDVMLTASDVLVDLVSEARGGAAVDADRSKSVSDQLNAFLGVEPEAEADLSADAAGEAEDISFPDLEPDELGFVPQQISIGGFGGLPSLDAPEVETAAFDSRPGWLVTFKPTDELYATANDSVILLRELSRIGEAEVTLNSDKLPELDVMEPENAYFHWTIKLYGDVDEEAIREVFEFVEDECELTIEPLGTDAAEPIEAPSEEIDIAPLAPTTGPEFDAIRAELLGQTPPTISEEDATHEPDIAPEPKAEVVADKEPAKPKEKAETKTPHGKTAQGTIRVDLDRVDKLIDLVGELVINQAMLAQHSNESGFSRAQGVGTGLDELERLTREIQDSVMAIRAQPVKSVFQRMPRLVREVSAMTGKKVRLETEGEGTEVDKTVIERLTDPLTHMIRNAIDHGLETPEDREAVGKPPEGVVTLAANHRSGRIVIEVSDDGAGINRKKVREIAENKGLISPETDLTDDEVDNLIFMPGFSTADSVTNVSGRGVGMDVVRSSIEGLGGRITISSKPGEGSVFTMSLPLTLAVLDGMVVNVGHQAMIAPLNNVVETMRPEAGQIKYLGPSERVVALRDKHVPIVDLGQMMGLTDKPLNPVDGVCLLVENDAGVQIALLVDDIQGQRQVVIKSLEQNYRKVDLIAAATILGDGRVALIADIDAVISARQLSTDRTPSSVKTTVSLAS